MRHPKVVHSLLIIFFIGVVSGIIFFLVSRQLTPLMDEIVLDVAAAGTMRVNAAAAVPTPTSAEMTLNLLLTVPPTAIPPTPLPATPTPPPVATATTRTGVVNSDLVNLRNYPSLAGEVVGQAREGEQVTILETSNDGLWLQVCCPLGTSAGNQQSWLAAEFVNLAGQSTTAAQAPAEPAVRAASQSTDETGLTGRVNSLLVNLRNGPATDFASVGQVSEQTTVAITGRNATGDWWRICCPPGAPTESWISAEFIDLPIAREQALTQVPILITTAVPVTTLP